MGAEDLADIADRYPAQPSRTRVGLRSKHDRANAVDRDEFPFRANDVTPLAFFDVAGRDRCVFAAKLVGDFRNRQAIAGHLCRIDDDLQFALAAAEHIDAGDAGHPFEAILNGVFNVVAIAFDRLQIAGQAGEDEPGDRAVLGRGGL